mmetsp:Transcript_22023/g.33356  ORF Transcript_22023/g.33356 Transcript_22023/m.33356 type:complete len:84 (+) Transcript_22023:968-1219(+)
MLMWDHQLQQQQQLPRINQLLLETMNNPQQHPHLQHTPPPPPVDPSNAPTYPPSDNPTVTTFNYTNKIGSHNDETNDKSKLTL